MKIISLYQADAFADKLFAGNPAAVCPLDEWLSDNILQQIAAENNLAETAYFVKQNNQYAIRWFTPLREVDLCGHATLASAFILFNYLFYPGDEVQFHSRSGILPVTKKEDILTLNFPADNIMEVASPKELVDALGIKPLCVFKGKNDYLVLLKDEKSVKALKPDMRALSAIAARGIIITAKGDEADFVSRYFAPAFGIDEDPVTGSAHTTLAPFWSKKLQKQKLSARQLSKRGGDLFCEISGERILISGKCKLYSEGKIFLE